MRKLKLELTHKANLFFLHCRLLHLWYYRYFLVFTTFLIEFSYYIWSKQYCCHEENTNSNTSCAIFWQPGSFVYNNFAMRWKKVGLISNSSDKAFFFNCGWRRALISYWVMHLAFSIQVQLLCRLHVYTRDKQKHVRS